MLRIYLHSMQRGEFWLGQYLEADLKTPVGPRLHYSNLDRVRDILTRGNADATAREEFDGGIRRWGIGACFLTLTPAQYKNLKG